MRQGKLDMNHMIAESETVASMKSVLYLLMLTKNVVYGAGSADTVVRMYKIG